MGTGTVIVNISLFLFQGFGRLGFYKVTKIVSIYFKMSGLDIITSSTFKQS
jgi:hypothetical protein